MISSDIHLLYKWCFIAYFKVVLIFCQKINLFIFQSFKFTSLENNEAPYPGKKANIQTEKSFKVQLKLASRDFPGSYKLV